MKVFHGLEEAPADFGPSALTIGNFDGVHFGHRQILRRLKALAVENGWKASVLTFNPHPTAVVAPDRAPRLMTTPERRAELMAEEGVEQVLILPFTRELALLPPEEFVRQLLVERLGARVVLVGDNFRFGHKAAGNVRVLTELGKRLGFETEIVPAVRCRGRVVSSSGIRELIQAGQVSVAGRLLQHAYALEGEVVSGRGVGSKQTVPTLNLRTESRLIPARGVYVTRTYAVGESELLTAETPRRGENAEKTVGEWNSITNIGYRPTFGDSEELSIETFLLDPLEGETPRRIRVEFLWRVRDERKFGSPEALRAQILKDVRVAQSYFRRRKAWAWTDRVPCNSW